MASEEWMKRRIANGMVQRIRKLHQKVKAGTASAEEKARLAAIRGLFEVLID